MILKSSFVSPQHIKTNYNNGIFQGELEDLLILIKENVKELNRINFVFTKYGGDYDGVEVVAYDSGKILNSTYEIRPSIRPIGYWEKWEDIYVYHEIPGEWVSYD